LRKALERELTKPRVERRLERRRREGAEPHFNLEEPIERRVARGRLSGRVLGDGQAREGLFVHRGVLEAHESRGAKALGRVGVAAVLERDDSGVEERAVRRALGKEPRRQQQGDRRPLEKAPPSARGCSTRRLLC
jgi:hypothetical protein